MPTYVYRCKACEHQFETLQKMTDEPVKKCPECGSPVTRLLFPVGIVFKGSGFHVNDYPSSGARSDPSTGPGQDGKGKNADEKPESKSEPKEPTAASKD